MKEMIVNKEDKNYGIGCWIHENDAKSRTKRILSLYKYFINTFNASSDLILTKNPVLRKEGKRNGEEVKYALRWKAKQVKKENISKEALIHKIELALDENIYCGDIRYTSQKGEFSEIEGKERFLKEIRKVVDEYEESNPYD